MTNPFGIKISHSNRVRNNWPHLMKTLLSLCLTLVALTAFAQNRPAAPPPPPPPNAPAPAGQNPVLAPTGAPGNPAAPVNPNVPAPPPPAGMPPAGAPGVSPAGPAGAPPAPGAS